MTAVAEETQSAAARILDAAEALFAERGFDGASISALAEAAGVSKANIFHHFESKDALYRAVLESAFESFDDLSRTLAAPHGTFRQRLAGFIDQHLHRLLQRKHRTRLSLREMIDAERRPDSVLARNGPGAAFFGSLCEEIARRQEEGELRPDFDPKVLVSIVFGTSIFYFMTRETLPSLRRLGGKTKDREAYLADAIADIVSRGVLAPSRRTANPRIP